MVYMYQSFLIHSSADRHLGCFHVLAIINSAKPVLKGEASESPGIQRSYIKFQA